MQVVFVDNHLLVVEKPAGVVTQPDLVELAKAWIKKEYNKPGAVFLEPIHRLDRPVSGLVLFARTSKALSRLQEAMRQREIGKTYLALIEGAPPAEKGMLRHFLIHGDHRALVASQSEEGAKEAILEYSVRGRSGEHSLLEIVLHTGRYHQIRAQLSAIGCPVVGDHKYGAKTKGETIALHHGSMQCKHPVTQEVKCFLSKKMAAINPTMAAQAAIKLIWENATL